MGAIFALPLNFSVVAANENSLAPTTNANLDIPTRVWRSADLSTPYVIVDLGPNPVSYDTVALIGTNLRSTDTIQIRTGTTNTEIGGYAGTAQTAYSGTLPAGSTAKSIYQIGTRTERYVRIDITSTGNTDGYVQVQRIVIAKKADFNGMAGLEWGVEQGFVDQSQINSGAGWSTVDEYPVLQTMKVSASMIKNADWNAYWYPFFQQAGKKKAILVVLDDATPANWLTESIFGRITEEVVINLVGWDNRRYSIKITALSQ